MQIMVRFALLNTALGTIGYFANLISHTKKAIIMARPIAKGTRTCTLFHSYYDAGSACMSKACLDRVLTCTAPHCRPIMKVVTPKVLRIPPT